MSKLRNFYNSNFCAKDFRLILPNIDCVTADDAAGMFLNYWKLSLVLSIRLNLFKDMAVSISPRRTVGHLAASSSDDRDGLDGSYCYSSGKKFSMNFGD